MSTHAPRPPGSPGASLQRTSSAGGRELAGASPSPSLSVTASPSLRSISEIPLSPLPHHLAPYLLADSPLSPLEKRELFTATYLKAASAGHSDTLEWLLSVPESTQQSSGAASAAAARRFSASSLSAHSRSSSTVTVDEADTFPEHAPRKWIDVEAIDEDGNTALGLCVALGHAEGVRVDRKSVV